MDTKRGHATVVLHLKLILALPRQAANISAWNSLFFSSAGSEKVPSAPTVLWQLLKLGDKGEYYPSKRENERNAPGESE